MKGRSLAPAAKWASVSAVFTWEWSSRWNDRAERTPRPGTTTTTIASYRRITTGAVSDALYDTIRDAILTCAQS